MEALTAPVSTALLGVDPLLPIRILAGIAFIAMLWAFIYVLRHLRNIERKLIAENLLPTELGPRDNLVLIVCLVPLIVTTLLLFLIIKA
ncbi:MAG TPA: hypothetical protein VE758_10535 [Chthoniobacterales bacterium]|nr:hypothetical protein [Chthoniobacterales bacterium]